jgi:hypothetical protein
MPGYASAPLCKDSPPPLNNPFNNAIGQRQPRRTRRHKGK